MQEDNIQLAGSLELLNPALKSDSKTFHDLFSSLKEAEAALLYGQLMTLIAKQSQNVQALYLLGLLYHWGLGTEKDYGKAIEFFEQAITIGHAGAMNDRAAMHEHGRGGPVNYPDAIVLYEQAIALGNAAAMTHRAIMHELGRGGPVDYPAAIVLYEKAIALGNAAAIGNRAMMHENGWGGPVNYSAAIVLYEQVIALGNVCAMNNRAIMYSNGKGEPDNKPNFIAAARLLLKTVKAGSKTGMYNFRKLLERFDLNMYPEIEYLFTLARLHNKTDTNYKISNRCLVFLANDSSLSQDDKLNYFSRLFPNPEKILSSLLDAHEINAFGKLQIQIAERALRQSADVDDEDDSKLLHNTALQAFELADDAKEKLQKIPGTEPQQLYDTLHEQLILSLCHAHSATAQTDPKSFANSITDLRLIPTSRRANFLLMELVQLMNLEPYFSANEKQQLLLTLASRADPLEEDESVQKLAARAISEIKNPKHFSRIVDNTRFISFDQLVGYASDIVSKSEQTMHDPESITTLRALLQKMQQYDPHVEEALLRHPLVSEALTGTTTTYENALTQSVVSQQKLVPLTTIQNELLMRLDDLAHYYDIYPERFPSPLPENANLAADSLRFFHAQPNSNNENIRSLELKKIMPPSEEFTSFRKQKRITKAIGIALKSHQPSNFGVVLLSWVSKAAQQRIADSAIANELNALRKACASPNATASESIEKTFDYLSKLDLTKKPISPIISSLLQELIFLLGPEAKINKAQTSSAQRDQICEALKSDSKRPDLVSFYG